MNGVLTPRVPAATTPPTPAKVYFVELLLRRHGAVIDRNVYWLSTQPDVINWAKTLGNPQATMGSYANLTELNSLPAAAVRATAHTAWRHGADGANLVTRVTITNTSKRATVAFFLRADVLAGGAELQSATWNGNDITLWPGESQTLTVSYDAASLHGVGLHGVGLHGVGLHGVGLHGASLHGATPVINLSGWNVAGRAIAAPLP
jgi:exo-1,4-beta-D-glucosaminidase